MKVFGAGVQFWGYGSAFPAGSIDNEISLQQDILDMIGCLGLVIGPAHDEKRICTPVCFEQRGPGFRNDPGWIGKGWIGGMEQYCPLFSFIAPRLPFHGHFPRDEILQTAAAGTSMVNVSCLHPVRSAQFLAPTSELPKMCQTHGLQERTLGKFL